ncbi:Crp/Fnr family transcriptional regulator [Solitalea canadensis]|uniref:Cyclic nucleotide-binding protein n=1 Tax=Solitalea canadensis (strain ATCC 29591 / DSM 3403 / JCM 21819 / LMG 8368 / NBRC 15130 / NCIMB 12057 / USAM 9D) TaxID=929556 RepID=H8KPE0_SOLCM|nr:Crp/Fnr family transcriptional regulator [Solitalea canadensis]AFD05838.1 cyclic nucleotide-binding protein [Solitalea canadensis DSM 3403]
MSINKIIAHFDKYLPLESMEKEEFVKRLTERKIKRKQYILQEGDICKHLTYVVEGCFKMYAVDPKGNEHNLEFAAEDNWIVDIGSLHNEQPSRLFIEAIEPSLILQISKGDLWFMFSNYAKFDRNFRVIIEDKYIELQDRVLQNISSTAQDRYEVFIEQYPHLINRLPNTQIASYLGVTPEFLSKIRSERIGK